MRLLRGGLALLKKTIPTRLRQSCRCIGVVLLRGGSATLLVASIDTIYALSIEARTFTVCSYFAILLLGFFRLPILAIATAQILP